MATRLLDTAEELFAAAQLGHKLKPRERLAVVLYLEKSGKITDYAHKELALTLSCSPKALYKLRGEARNNLAAAISTEEAIIYLADYVREIDILLVRAHEGLSKVPIGSGAHQAYIRILRELSDAKMDKLQSVGVIPKELGRLTSAKEEWVAEVSTEGVVGVHEEAGDGSHGTTQ